MDDHVDELCLKQVVNSLRTLQQISTIDRYFRCFEFLSMRVLRLCPWFPPGYFLSRFIWGLKVELQPYVLQFNPTNVIDAYDLTCIYEYSLKRSKHYEFIAHSVDVGSTDPSIAEDTPAKDLERAPSICIIPSDAKDFVASRDDIIVEASPKIATSLLFDDMGCATETIPQAMVLGICVSAESVLTTAKVENMSMQCPLLQFDAVREELVGISDVLVSIDVAAPLVYMVARVSGIIRSANILDKGGTTNNYERRPKESNSKRPINLVLMTQTQYFPSDSLVVFISWHSFGALGYCLHGSMAIQVSRQATFTVTSSYLHRLDILTKLNTLHSLEQRNSDITPEKYIVCFVPGIVAVHIAYSSAMQTSMLQLWLSVALPDQNAFAATRKYLTADGLLNWNTELAEFAGILLEKPSMLPWYLRLPAIVCDRKLQWLETMVGGACDSLCLQDCRQQMWSWSSSQMARKGNLCFDPGIFAMLVQPSYNQCTQEENDQMQQLGIDVEELTKYLCFAPGLVCSYGGCSLEICFRLWVVYDVWTVVKWDITSTTHEFLTITRVFPKKTASSIDIATITRVAAHYSMLFVVLSFWTMMKFTTWGSKVQQQHYLTFLTILHIIACGAVQNSASVNIASPLHTIVTQYLLGLRESYGYCVVGVWEQLKSGSRNRFVGSTSCTENVTVRGANGMNDQSTKSNLWLLDLAGSEHIGGTEVASERLKESQFINMLLSVLGGSYKTLMFI